MLMWLAKNFLAYFNFHNFTGLPLVKLYMWLFIFLLGPILSASGSIFCSRGTVKLQIKGDTNGDAQCDCRFTALMPQK